MKEASALMIMEGLSAREVSEKLEVNRWGIPVGVIARCLQERPYITPPLEGESARQGHQPAVAPVGGGRQPFTRGQE